MMKTGLVWTAVAAILMCGMAWWTMTNLPSSGDIPVHWNYKGEADRYAPVSEAKKTLWLIPGLSIFTSLILAVGLKVDPRRKNIQRSGRAYLGIWLGTLALMTLVTGLVCYSMLKGASTPNASLESLPNIIVGLISLLLLIMGNYLPKTRSNWFFGIRTPWTLSSEEAWEKTHRITGRLFMVLGLLGLVSVFIMPLTWQLPIMIGGSLAITGFSLIYSYLVWRDASDRQTTPEYIE